MSSIFSISALDTIEQAIHTSDPNLLIFLEETPEYFVKVTQEAKDLYLSLADETIDKYKKALNDPLLTSIPGLKERWLTLSLSSSACIYLIYIHTHEDVLRRAPISGILFCASFAHSILNLIRIINTSTNPQAQELLKKAEKVKELLIQLPVYTEHKGK